MRGSSLVFCNHCGKEFRIKNCALRRGRGRFCSLKCKSESQVGKIASPEGLFKKGIVPWNKGKRYKQPKQTRELHSQWKGGVTVLQTLLRNSTANKEWRIDVFQTNNYTCQKCGHKGGKLEAHHIKPFSGLLEQNRIRTFEEGLNCNDLWDRSNGITLCKTCHRQPPAPEPEGGEGA